MKLPVDSQSISATIINSRANTLLQSCQAVSALYLTLCHSCWLLQFGALLYLSDFCFLIQFMPESARFYVVKGEMDKAEKVIRRIAWYNCRHPPKVCACSQCVSVPCLFLPAYHTEGYTTRNVHVKITDYLSNNEVHIFLLYKLVISARERTGCS